MTRTNQIAAVSMSPGAVLQAKEVIDDRAAKNVANITNMSGANNRLLYIPAFDGLRTICIAAVMFHHVCSNNVQNRWVQQIAQRGWYGVDVFFVLSGFLITMILASELESSGTINLGRFYIRRFLRLQPAYFSAILLMLIVQALSRPAGYQRMLHALPFFLTYTLNIAEASGLATPLGLAWSLCIEEQFYLTWPFILRRLGLQKALPFTVVMIAAICVYRSTLYCWLNWGHLASPTGYSVWRIYYGTDTRFDTILVGCALALFLRSGFKQPLLEYISTAKWFPTLAVVTAVLCIYWGTGPQLKGGWRAATFGYSIMAISTGSIVWALFKQPECWLAKGLSLRHMVSVGKVSYGVYLFQTLIVGLIAGALHMQHQAPVSVSKGFTALALAWFITVIFAKFHYRFVERKFLDLRNSDWFRKRSLVTAVTETKRAVQSEGE